MIAKNNKYQKEWHNATKPFRVMGIGLLKGKSNRKKSRKKISQIIVRQRKGAFFGKEVLRKCAKSNVGRKNR
jgi:hypothetical protein